MYDCRLCACSVLNLLLMIEQHKPAYCWGSSGVDDRPIMLKYLTVWVCNLSLGVRCDVATRQGEETAASESDAGAEVERSEASHRCASRERRSD